MKSIQKMICSTFTLNGLTLSPFWKWKWHYNWYVLISHFINSIKSHFFRLDKDRSQSKKSKWSIDFSFWHAWPFFVFVCYFHFVYDSLYCPTNLSELFGIMISMKVCYDLVGFFFSFFYFFKMERLDFLFTDIVKKRSEKNIYRNSVVPCQVIWLK